MESCLCSLHSGCVLASASGDGSAKLWRFREGKCTATLLDHQQPGESCRGGAGVGGQGCRVHAGTLWLYSVGLQLACWRGRPRHLLTGPHGQALGCIKVSGRASRRVWHVKPLMYVLMAFTAFPPDTRGVCHLTLRGHADSVNSVQFLSYSNLLSTCSADKTVSLWDARAVSHSGPQGGGRARLSCADL